LHFGKKMSISFFNIWIYLYVGTLTYRIKFPYSCRLYPIFHICKLKKNVAAKSMSFGDQKCSEWVSLGNTYFLWWQHAEKIATLSPNFHLEDKVTFERGMMLAMGDSVLILTEKEESSSKIGRFRFKILF